MVKYFDRISAGADVLPLMKASHSATATAPLVNLPREILERVFMYCTVGRLSTQEVRRLCPAGVLLGMDGITDREIVHVAVAGEMQPELCFPSQIRGTS